MGERLGAVAGRVKGEAEGGPVGMDDGVGDVFFF